MRMREWRSIVVGIALCLPCLGIAQAQETSVPKIGVVDVNLVLQDFSMTRDLLKQFKEKASQRKSELEAKDKEIEDKSSKLQDQSLILTDEERGKLDQEIKDLEEAKQKFVSQMNAELAPDKRLLQKTVDEALEEKIKPAIRKLGERDKYTMVLLVPNDGILYYDETVDLTKQVLALLEQEG